jgi:hypothetical protein
MLLLIITIHASLTRPSARRRRSPGNGYPGENVGNPALALSFSLSMSIDDIYIHIHAYMHTCIHASMK